MIRKGQTLSSQRPRGSTRGYSTVSPIHHLAGRTCACVYRSPPGRRTKERDTALTREQVAMPDLLFFIFLSFSIVSASTKQGQVRSLYSSVSLLWPSLIDSNSSQILVWFFHGKDFHDVVASFYSPSVQFLFNLQKKLIYSLNFHIAIVTRFI
jgi:hypothetical protein